MKKLIIASIVINILLILFMFDDFLSLHDIREDYVSKSVLSYLHVDISAKLPAWTDTSLEWASVTISYAARLILIVSNLVVLFFLRKRIQCGYDLSSVHK